MRKLLIRAVLAIVAATGVVAIAAAAAPDPVIGTWQLNVSKSKFTRGPAPKSETRTYSQSGPSITLVIKRVGADGNEMTSQATYQLDGKDYSWTGDPSVDSLSVKQVDSNTVKFTQKKAGKVVSTGSRTVSKDGKTLTLKSKGTTAKGEKSENVGVFDRQ
jgi:hypothetical protein